MSSGVKVKVCGITRESDALYALEQGAWALGFIFQEASPRFITPHRASEIILKLKSTPYGNRKMVGVFVNAPLDHIAEVITSCDLSGIQLHGEESSEYCDELLRRFSGVDLIKAFRIKDTREIHRLSDYKFCKNFLIDAFVEGSHGGTGRLSNWESAKLARPYGNVILSGGLSASNVRAALSEVKPFAIDISSGLESAPGIKCTEKIKSFFSEVRNF